MGYQEVLVVIEIPGGTSGNRDPRRFWQRLRYWEVLAVIQTPGGTGGEYPLLVTAVSEPPFQYGD